MRSRLIPGLAVAALLVAACEVDDAPDTADDTADDTVGDDTVGNDTVDDEAVEDDAIEDDATDEEAVEEDAIEDSPVAEGEVLTVASTDLGDHLVGPDGMTVYIHPLDQAALEEEDQPACVGDCVAVWSPVLVADTDPEVGGDVDADLVGTIERDDAEIIGGSTQLTYDGYPLYTFVTDTEPGDTRGQELAQLWFVIGPDGEPIGEVPGDEELDELDVDEEEAED